MDTVGFIFARGGSKGIPNKNLVFLAGKPLLAWSIEHAKAVPRIRRVIVSTDSEEIAEVARAYGAETPFLRPAELATDNAPEWLAWRHALNYLKDQEGKLPDAMVSIPTTAPLRKPLDIEKCLDEYIKGKTDAVITTSKANRSPYFNMVRKNYDGTVSLVIPSKSKVLRRQDSPIVYNMTTVAYVVNSKFVFMADSIFSGSVRAVQVPIQRAIDIDTPLDLQIAEILLKIKKPELKNQVKKTKINGFLNQNK